ncbi:hypothetical protein AMECASPLE_001091 [Ameca splendens]|uniref:Uncharacterized protein n=1 Tax=Ameca splendens TaxID=208324 RepID=A0ABV0XLY9_9TELE
MTLHRLGFSIPQAGASSGITSASASQKQRKNGCAHGGLTQSITGCGAELCFTPEPAFTPLHITPFHIRTARQAFSIRVCGFPLLLFSYAISDFLSTEVKENSRVSRPAL